MASKTTKNSKNTVVRNNQNKSKTLISNQKLNFSDKIDPFFSKNLKIIFGICLAILVIFCATLFDINVGMGGDDSAFILRAYDLTHHFTYPGYQGPLYPCILSLFILFFGINLFILKLLSLIFIVIGYIFFYKAFKSKIPAQILTIALVLLSVNYFFLYYSSQTYSETFFMMLQFILFWYFGKYFLERNDDALKKIKNYLLLGLILFLMTITRNLAVACIGIIVLFFLSYRRWKDALFTFLSYSVFYGIFELIKRLIWGNTSLQFSSQGTGLLYKDFYNPAMGKEDLHGFFMRLIDNSNLYFSKHVFRFLGIIDENSINTSGFLTILIYVLLITMIIIGLRKNKFLFLTSIYVLFMSILTFLALQKSWDQWRLMIIYYPFILVLLFSAIYYIFKNRMKVLQPVLMLGISLIIFFSSYSVIHKHVAVQTEILHQNLAGNSLYGWTPDWQNYISMSKWAAKNVPANTTIGCRKPEIAFIYSEREFYRVSKVPSISPDSLISAIPSSDHYIAVRINQVTKPNEVPITDPFNRKHLLALPNGKFSFNTESTENYGVVAIFKFSESEFAQIKSKPEFINSLSDSDLTKWLHTLGLTCKDFAIYEPDILLNQLRRDNVRYLIAASLRANPNVCDGNIISTVQRYIYFTQIKYPEIFMNAGVMGSQEPATLVQLAY